VRQEIRDSTRFAFVREDLAAIAFCVIEPAGVAAADFCLAGAFRGWLWRHGVLYCYSVFWHLASPAMLPRKITLPCIAVLALH
jgi:hypothetical protein